MRGRRRRRGDGMLCRYYMVNTLAALHDRSFFLFFLDGCKMDGCLFRDFFFGKFGSVKRSA